MSFEGRAQGMVLLMIRNGEAVGGNGSMKDGMARLATALLITIAGAGLAQGSSISITDFVSFPHGMIPGEPRAGLFDLERGLTISDSAAASKTPDLYGLTTASTPIEMAAPEPSRDSEPASMGLFGIGITGLITLRRFRRYFS